MTEHGAPSGRANSETAARCVYDRAGCVRPDAKEKYARKAYVCECGRQHFAVRDSSNWAGNGWEWEYKL